MKITKNKLITALKFLGEDPKTSEKKDELDMKLNDIYDNNIDKLTTIINTKIYQLIKKLVQADENGIEIERKYEPEAYFLESILVIEEFIVCGKKIHIKFCEGMKERFTKFVNSKNEEIIKSNQIIIDLIINILYAYGVIEDYEMTYMLSKLLKSEIDIDYVIELFFSQIDLRSEIILVEDEEKMYLINSLVKSPEDIIEEREEMDLCYKEYTKKELLEFDIENFMDSKEAKDVIEFYEKKKFNESKDLVFALIIYIMNICGEDSSYIERLMSVVNIKDIDEANELLQLIVNLYNSIPHYSLYGYSPNELMKMKVERMKKEEEIRKKQKIGRNDPCPCGSGRKYKNCCMNKVIKVDFRNKKNSDCIDEEDSKMFFVLKDLLFHYTNQKYHINEELEDLSDIFTSQPDEIIEIREKIWNDKNVIKEYLKENPNRLDSKIINILEQWNNKKLNKEFILYKYEDEYAVFMDDDYVYYVKGLKDSIRTLVSEAKLPTFVKTVLLPLNDQIIYDSYIQEFSMSMGKNMKDICNKNFKSLINHNKVKYKL